MNDLICDICGEVIHLEDGHYKMPDGSVVCEECLTDWAKPYWEVGEVDLDCGGIPV